MLLTDITTYVSGAAGGPNATGKQLSVEIAVNLGATQLQPVTYIAPLMTNAELVAAQGVIAALDKLANQSTPDEVTLHATVKTKKISLLFVKVTLTGGVTLTLEIQPVAVAAAAPAV